MLVVVRLAIPIGVNGVVVIKTERESVPGGVVRHAGRKPRAALNEFKRASRLSVRDVLGGDAGDRRPGKAQESHGAGQDGRQNHGGDQDFDQRVTGPGPGSQSSGARWATIRQFHCCPPEYLLTTVCRVTLMG